MGLTATARSSGDTLRQEVVVDGRHDLVTDEPERLGGTDAGPTPHELLSAAIAACIATTIRAYARKKSWDVGEVAVHVDYDHDADPRRFTVAVDLPAELAEDRVERLMQVAARCPVRRALEAGAVFEEPAVPSR